jgi:hypothetical protein
MSDELVKVNRLTIDGDNAPLNAPLTIALEYELTQPLTGAYWVLTYEADMANKRQTVTVHTTAAADLAPGVHQFQHTAPEVKTGDIKKKYLLQVGLLKLALHSAAVPDVTTINMVTQVSESADGLIRNIINPADE